MSDALLKQTMRWRAARFVAALMFCVCWSVSPYAVVHAASQTMTADGLAQTSLRQRYPENAWTSFEQTERALRDAALERDLTETAFKARQRECYKRFFATACLNKAKEERRMRLAIANTVQIEAERYRRELRAKEREQARKEEEEQRAREALTEAAQAAANARAYQQRLADHARAQAEREAEQDAEREKRRLTTLQTEQDAKAAKEAREAKQPATKD